MHATVSNQVASRKRARDEAHFSQASLLVKGINDYLRRRGIGFSFSRPVQRTDS